MLKRADVRYDPLIAYRYQSKGHKCVRQPVADKLNNNLCCFGPDIVRRACDPFPSNGAATSNSKQRASANRQADCERSRIGRVLSRALAFSRAANKQKAGFQLLPADGTA
jgi:hypothetical protein